MDSIERLEAAAKKAREFDFHLEGTERTYTLRMPTRAETIEIASRRNIDTKLASGAGAWLWLRYQLEDAIIGWTGVRERDLVPGGGSSPVEWSARAVRLHLDAMAEDDFQRLALELQRKSDEREAALKVDAGN